MGNLSAKFLSAGNPSPLEDRDIIAIGQNYDKSHLHVDNNNNWLATNFRHILETGDAAANSRINIGYDHSIDWNADDAYTNTVEDITEQVSEQIRNDPELSALLEKGTWDHNDRVLWEKNVSEMVSDAIDNTPGFDQYRTEAFFESDLDGILEATEKRSTIVNAISSDLENDTSNIEFDCEIMAITEGSIMQKLDDAFLPEDATEGDLKKSSSYFYAGGQVAYLNPDDTFLTPGSHAFIISSATGNIIEATSEASNIDITYMQAADDYSFRDFISGEPFAHPDVVYFNDYEQETIDRTNEKMDELPFDAHIQSTREHITATAEYVNEHANLPEFQALGEYQKIYETRLLTGAESENASDLITNSEAADNINQIIIAQQDLATHFNSLYELADTPEDLQKLRDLMSESDAVFSGTNDIPLYSWKDVNGGEAGYMSTLKAENMVSIDEINVKIDALIGPEQAPTPPIQQVPPLQLKTEP